jgi:hypothetical protein
MGSLEKRVLTLENQVGKDTPDVFLIVHEGPREIFTPEEKAALRQHKEQMIAAAKPGDRFVAIFWTREKVQELLTGGPQGGGAHD